MARLGGGARGSPVEGIEANGRVAALETVRGEGIPTIGMNVMHKPSREAERQAFERVKGLLFLRLAAVLVSLAVILVSQAGRGVFQAELFPTYLLLVIVCLFNLGYLLVIDRLHRARRFAAVQIYVDVLFASALIYLTGVGDSNITFLYFACILAASTILGLRPGVAIASLATVLLAGMTTLSHLAGYYGWELPWVNSRGPMPPAIGISSGVAYLMAQAVAYYLVAILAGRLSHGLSGVRLLNEKILENISDGVLAIDNERHVRSINREAARLLNLPSASDMQDKPLDELIGLSGNGEVLRELFSGEQPSFSQLVLAPADGGTAPVAVTSSALRDERGQRLGLLVTFIDLTERKRLEEALARAETMEMVGQLAATIAHEIRNPLACIRGSAQEIRSELAGDDQPAKLLDLVIRESDRINAIVTNFLHFSKMRHTALTRCNLTDVLTDVVTMLESRQADERVQVEFSGDEPVFCLGDVEQLRQVFLNLGLNALEAMPRGGRLEVNVRKAEEPLSADGLRTSLPRVEVEFTDQGEGMTGEVKARLFNPFFTTKPRGTGLGLSIVHRIVEAHRGRIEVDSAVGHGSTFRVVLEGDPARELQVSHV